MTNNATTAKALDSLSNLWAEVDKARLRHRMAITEGAPVPDSAFTIREYAERYSLTYPTAAYQLKQMEREKTLTSGLAYRTTSYGRFTITKVFWLTEGECKTKSSGGTMDRTIGKT